jgi:hypothetical protein
MVLHRFTNLAALLLRSSRKPRSELGSRRGPCGWILTLMRLHLHSWLHRNGVGRSGSSSRAECGPIFNLVRQSCASQTWKWPVPTGIDRYKRASRLVPQTALVSQNSYSNGKGAYQNRTGVNGSAGRYICRFPAFQSGFARVWASKWASYPEETCNSSPARQVA